MSLIDNVIDGLTIGTIGTACGAVIGAATSYHQYSFLSFTNLNDVLTNISVLSANSAIYAAAFGSVCFLGGTTYSACYDLYYGEQIII